MRVKRLLIVIAVLIFLSCPFIASAQKNTARTRVGNPPQNNDVVKVASDIKSAYDKCNNGNTRDPNGTLASCLRESLSSGYDSALLDAFESRRQKSLVVHPIDGALCTQCLGYVGLVLTLLTGDTNTLLVSDASDVSKMTTFTAGGMTFQRIDPSEPLLPGDIGSKSGGSGHIAIVNQPLGNIRFTALESNGNFDCHITDNRSINKEPYYFFRKL